MDVNVNVKVKVSQTCVASEEELILARASLFGDSDGAILQYAPNIVQSLG